MTQAVRDAVRAMVMRSTNSATGRVEAVSMLTYAHICSHMLTYAHVCSRMQALAQYLSVSFYLTLIQQFGGVVAVCVTSCRKVHKKNDKIKI